MHALADERPARERVEQRRLARARRPGQRDHRRLEAVPEPLAGPAHDRARRLDARVGSSRPSASSAASRERREPGLQRAAHRARSSASTAASSRSSPASEPVPRRPRAAPRSAPASVASSARARSQQVLARLRRERAHGLVAEQRLEHALADRGGPARDRDLGARQAARVGEHGDHHHEPGAVDAERGDARRRALAGGLAADELEHGALPRADLLAGARPAARARRRPGAPCPPAGRGPPGRPRQAAAARSAARSAAA